MKLIEYCKLYNKIFIYGAGKRGKWLYSDLTRLDISIAGFVVSDGEKAFDFEGINILELSTWIKQGNINNGLLIAVSEKYRLEIINNLYQFDKKDYLYVRDDHFEELFRYMNPVIPKNFITSTAPVGRLFGYDRGMPIDRYYIEKFLNSESKASNNTSRLLEVGEDTYSKKYYPQNGNISYDILDYNNGNDLTDLNTLPQGMYDVFICTQVFNFIYNVRSAIQGSYYLLKSGGRMLATVAGNISPVSRYDMERYGHYWGFTYLAIEKLVAEVFGRDNISVIPFGNCLAATAFVQGMAVEDIDDKSLLDITDVDYAITIGIVAQKC